MNDAVWIIVFVLILILFKLGYNHRGGGGTNIKPPSFKPRPNVHPAPQPKL